MVDALIAVARRQKQIIEQIADAVRRSDKDATFRLAAQLIE